jgi:putative DNA-invertase from lambdoid prophage Rac
LARPKTPQAGLYARVSTHDQQTLPMQLRTMRAYAKQRGWNIGMEVRDVGSDANVRPQREAMLRAARRRELDIILVWRLDRWGRSLLDLIGTLQELNELGVGFVSLSEALDLTTSSGRALAGMLAVFAEFERDILRDRVKAGIAQARQEGRPHGRPAPSGVTLTTSASSTKKAAIRKRKLLYVTTAWLVKSGRGVAKLPWRDLCSMENRPS